MKPMGRPMILQPVLPGIVQNKSVLNILKPSGFFTYHQVQHSKILHGARFALSVFTDFRTNNGFCFIHHYLIGFYNRGGKCLQRGTV
jgi:hypothetical protein